MTEITARLSTALASDTESLYNGTGAFALAAQRPAFPLGVDAIVALSRGSGAWLGILVYLRAGGSS